MGVIISMDEYYNDLLKSFSETKDIEEMKKLFSEMFTESEIHDFQLRWALLDKLTRGMSQRDIASDLGISLCKITRGAKLLKNKDSKLYEIFSKKEK